MLIKNKYNYRIDITIIVKLLLVSECDNLLMLQYVMLFEV
ncbi:hypothetical protein SAMN02745132_01192 [Enterovibrio nigricans DSM 22720]|uniref:Uncharacterized protein n=1 Tax=Enterovibrio nigricans DSM 22720 TaxID=1121868 RepID=A0A1T4UA37_9GAMM|nr:hypothetical protein SAMN02745132_01192 [Enterovibrio nigricans DSM 22720]